MPTGYTMRIREQTFQEFVMGCARSFGACIDMRDEKFDEPVPDFFVVKDFYYENVQEAHNRLNWLTGLSPIEVEIECNKEHDTYIISQLKLREDMLELKQVYFNTLEKVNNWNPPTKDHTELKSFMVDQLNKSIKIDTDDNWYKSPHSKPSPSDWYKTQHDIYSQTLQYHTTKLQEECIRVEKNNLWIKELRESLEIK